MTSHLLWQLADETWQNTFESDQWPVTSDQRPVGNDQCQVTYNHWRMKDERPATETMGLVITTIDDRPMISDKTTN